MQKDPIRNLLNEAWLDLRDPSSGWEVGALLLALGIAWYVGRVVHFNGAEAGLRKFGAGGVKRLLFPLLALLLVAVSIGVLRSWTEVDVLRLAVPLLTSLALVRTVFYALRYVFPPGGLLRSFERTISLIVWVVLVLHLFGLLPGVVDLFEEVSFSVGRQKLNLWVLMQGAFWVAVTMLAALWIGGMAEARLLQSSGLDSNLRVAFARLVRALLVVVAVLVTLPLVGIDLTVLSVFGGALGVGLGFGLQKIASNYMSGFIILLERSVRHGDMITADGFYGEVKGITTRCVVVKGMDGREAIIPNETFITQTVLNHSFTSREVRVALPVQISYDSNLERAMQLLVEAAKAQPRVLADPAPGAYVVRFADSGIDLELGIWIRDPEAGQANVRSDIYLAVWRAFQKEGISIPYPQREVRLIPTPNSPPNSGK